MNLAWAEICNMIFVSEFLCMIFYYIILRLANCRLLQGYRARGGGVLVAAGVITEGSVDCALKRQALQKGAMLYETLMSQLIQGRLAPYLADEVKKKLEILRDRSVSQ